MGEQGRVWLGEGEVAGFAGVGFQVEELLGAVAAVVDDVLVRECAQHTALAAGRAELALLGDGEGAIEGFAGFDGRFEGCAAKARGRGNACEVAEGGEDVDEGGERSVVFYRAAGQERRGEDKRNADGFLIEGGFLDPAMRAHAFAVVGGEGDEGVGSEAGVIKGTQEAADVLVDVLDEAVVIVEVEAEVVGGPLRGDANAL